MQNARDDDIGLFADQPASLLDHDHRAVIEIADALVRLLAFANDVHVQFFARQHDGLDRVGELVDVEHLDAFDLRDAIEIVVVGEELAPSSRARRTSFASTFPGGISS